MAWAGAAAAWSMVGGVAVPAHAADADFHFVQISDSHIGFDKPANPDVKGSLAEAVRRASALEPDLVLHTGDVTHLSRPAEFDDARQIVSSLSNLQVVPGEHDVLDEGRKAFFERFGPQTWRSFDHKGVHFVALLNVLELADSGAGQLGRDQLDWLSRDLAARKADTPIVVFTHMPMWDVHPAWGWATVDADPALALLRRFGSVAVLCGHIHQALRKVEGTVTLHTGRSTAFPQPAPGSAPAPGPLKVPAGQLRSVLGLTDVRTAPLTLADRNLEAPR
jgi:3',5'-cyclic AMP phosphodiesterase CpdA